MPEVDGGALVARVLGEQRVTHLFAINGGHTFPDPRPFEGKRRQAHPHAARAGGRLCGGRVGAQHWEAGSVLRHGRLRAHQRDHRPDARGHDQQRCRLYRGPASLDRGWPRIVPGSVRLGDLRELRQVHQACPRLEHDRGSCPSGLPGRWQRAAGGGAGRDPPEHPLPARCETSSSVRVRRCTNPTSFAAREIPAPSSGPLTSCSAPSGRCSSAETGSSGPARQPSCVSLRNSPARRCTAVGQARAPSPRTILWRCGAPGRSPSPGGRTWSPVSGSGSGAASTSASRRPGPRRPPTFRSTPIRSGSGPTSEREVPIVGDPKLVLRQMIELARERSADRPDGVQVARGARRGTHGLRGDDQRT